MAKNIPPHDLQLHMQTSLSLKASAVLDRFYGLPGGSSKDRPDSVASWAWALSEADGPLFWEVIQDVWPSFDLIPQKTFARLFARFAASAPPVNLPERMTVYRGQSGDVPKGLSWTLSRTVAEEFARGHRGIRNRNPVVLELEINRDQVAMYLTDREEDAVVLKAIPD